MNVFNRVVVVVLLLTLLAGIIYVALQPAQAVQYTQTGVTSVGTFFNNAEEASRWLFAGGRISLGLAAVVLICWLLWKELKPRRPKTVKIHTEGNKQRTHHDGIGVEAARLAYRPVGRRDRVTPEVTAFGALGQREGQPGNAT